MKYKLNDVFYHYTLKANLTIVGTYLRMNGDVSYNVEDLNTGWDMWVGEDRLDVMLLEGSMKTVKEYIGPIKYLKRLWIT